jgi:NTE family protein
MSDLESECEAGRPPEPGMALCLSGGGYRAMVFHVGSLWRLYELGLLGKMRRFSSVSGGSIAAGFLGLVWPKLSFDPGNIATDFIPHFVAPLRALASTTIDTPALVKGLLFPGSLSDKVAAAYEKHLFGKATLQDLPDQPRFVLTATSLQSGALWRFSKPYMRDYHVGEVLRPTVGLAEAVAASSAFPPILSPARLKLDPRAFTPSSGQDLQKPPFTSEVMLTDGGVYDNLGLEPVWKRYDTVFVSDGGGQLQAEEQPARDWARHALRVLELIDNQVRSLRKRWLLDSYAAPVGERNHRQGAYWSIRADIAGYRAPGQLACPVARTLALASVATRLREMDATTQERLINWGYAATDAAVRSFYDPSLSAPADFPYPRAGV